MAMPAGIAPAAGRIAFALAEPAAGGGLFMDDMVPPFLSAAKICSGGVKLKSASVKTISCWSARSR